MILSNLYGGGKIGLDENKIIYTHTRGALITHIIDESFNSQEKEVIDFIDYNHTSVHLVCLEIGRASCRERV